MKLYFDKRLKYPTYYGQQGFRNGKKVTSKNIKNFGKHSELLRITDAPETYVQEQICLSCPVQKILGPPEMNCLQSWKAAFITNRYEFSTEQGHHVRRVFL